MSDLLKIHNFRDQSLKDYILFALVSGLLKTSVPLYTCYATSSSRCASYCTYCTVHTDLRFILNYLGFSRLYK